MPIRNTPLFIIDRSRHAKYPYIYLVCTDKEFPFVAKCQHFKTNEDWKIHVESVNKSKFYDFTKLHHFKTGGVSLSIDSFILNNKDLDNPSMKRVKTLLNKGLKKILHAEKDLVAAHDLSIENQIKMMQETVIRAQANYDDLVKRSSIEEADFNIALAQAAVESLKILL